MKIRNVAATAIIVWGMVSSHWENLAAEVELVIGAPLEGERGLVAQHAGVLESPFGVDFDSRGRLYVVELEGGRVHRLDRDGGLKRIAGDGSKGYAGDGMEAAKAVFNGMHNLAISADDQLYISDSWNHCIRKIDLKSGLISTVAGLGEAGFAGDGQLGLMAQFDFLMCLTLTPTEDAVLIADLRNRRIRRWDLESEIVTTLAGNGEKAVPTNGTLSVEAPLVDPRAVAGDRQGRVYILERGGHALRRVDPEGRIETVAGSGQRGYQDGIGTEAAFNSPKHICLDAADRVFIADDQNAVIRLFDPTSRRVSTVMGRNTQGRGIRLARPHGVTVQGAWLYVVDTGHNRILRLLLP